MFFFFKIFSEIKANILNLFSIQEQINTEKTYKTKLNNERTKSLNEAKIKREIKKQNLPLKNEFELNFQIQKQNFSLPSKQTPSH